MTFSSSLPAEQAALQNAFALTAAEVAERKDFLELSEGDQALLRDLHRRLHQEGAELADAFYEHLQRYPRLAELLREPGRLDRLKKTQAAYFLRLTTGEYEADYVQERLDIGVVHHRIGLDPKWYIGAYRKYLSYLFPLIYRLYENQAELLVPLYDALIKIISFDMGLALEAYFEADRQEILRHKNYAEQLIATLPDGLAVVDETLCVRSHNPAMAQLLCSAGAGLVASPFFAAAADKRAPDTPAVSLVGMPFFSLVEDQALQAKLTEVLGGTSVIQGQLVRVVCKNVVRHLDFQISPVLVDRRRCALVITKDVTERIKIRNELRESEERFRLTFNLAGVGLAHLAPDGKILRVNQRMQEILGYGEQELQEMDYQEIIHPDDRHADREPLQQLLSGEVDSYSFEKRYRHKQGHYVWTQFSLSAVSSDKNEASYFIVVLEDISERKRTADELSRLAQYDALTSLPNRVLLHDRLKHAINGAVRSQRQLALLFLDLDRFKDVNDSLGHEAGDSMLMQISQRLSLLLRESDTVARLGGDEFVILLEDIERDEQAAVVARKVLTAIAQPITLRNVEFLPTASVGISFFPKDGQDNETLLRNADTAMYRAKELGKNTFEFYSEEMNHALLDRLKIESGLRHALQNNELKLHFQPQVKVGSGQIIGVEALIRWESAQHETVGPDIFIPIAEESGLIVPIGEWVLRQACRRARSWHEQGMNAIHITVNLSARQLREDIVSTVRNALRETGCDPTWLTLELTESMLMQSPDVIEKKLKQLSLMGVHIAVDDFGTGYSSLAYLRKFPIHTLKIDRHFISDVNASEDSMAIVRAVIALGRAMGYQVVAEGVERQDQIDMLTNERCDEMQGFFFCRPLPEEQLLPMLREGFLSDTGEHFSAPIQKAGGKAGIEPCAEEGKRKKPARNKTSSKTTRAVEKT